MTAHVNCRITENDDPARNGPGTHRPAKDGPGRGRPANNGPTGRHRAHSGPPAERPARGGGRHAKNGPRPAQSGPSLLARASTASALTFAVVGGGLLVPGASAEAEAATLATKALNIAASKRGAPYKYGAAGPSRFDCSGLTLYSFKRAGKTLPRTAQSQYNKTRHISASQRQRGDLVFFHRGRSVYHVGIYAGSNKMWHSPRRGTVVRLERIWTKSVWYGRVK
ncbi:hypothetical protein GCM10018987_48650 [Streptomyces cremeus]